MIILALFHLRSGNLKLSVEFLYGFIKITSAEIFSVVARVASLAVSEWAQLRRDRSFSQNKRSLALCCASCEVTFAIF